MTRLALPLTLAAAPALADVPPQSPRGPNDCTPLAERQRAEKAESQAAGLAKAGDVLALRLRHIVGPEDIVLRWENARAALRQDEGGE